MLLNFFIRFSTRTGQTLFVSGTGDALGNEDTSKALPLQYLNEEFWHGQVELSEAATTIAELKYNYVLRDELGHQVIEWGDDRIIDLQEIKVKTLYLIDTWNHAGNYENAFFSKPFQEILLRSATVNSSTAAVTAYTHEFRVKTPLLDINEVVCLAGSGKSLGNWDTKDPIQLSRSGNWWVAKANLTKDNFPLSYKYGIYNTKEKSFVNFENGSNRTLLNDSKKDLTILHDGFVHLPIRSWKGSGLAIPVFSLRSANSFGSGEFTDIKLLVDWAKITGMKLIQLLPVNDTTATHTWVDSYPYSAISAFALHPIYLNLEKVAGKKYASVISPLIEKQKELNGLAKLDYEAVTKIKYATIEELYALQKDEWQKDKAYAEFFELNKHWLVPYAAFCYLRDKYKTADSGQWKTNSEYDEQAIQKLVSTSQKHYDKIAVHYFTQYHLHLQLKEATAYAHKNGIIVKGDLPIGIYRYSADAWMNPSLYNLQEQAGAPPDDFAVRGQNWGFPTYNWPRMRLDNFAWWRQRFEQMGEYFDAFRIDHILGFFRIWSIPSHAVEGILGRFVPAIPVHINELHQRNISYHLQRFCKPYITDGVLYEIFGDGANYIKETFLNGSGGWYELKTEFDTQRKVENYFTKNPSPGNIKTGLFDLISNVILIEEEGSQMQQFHFRINMDHTTSFRDLDGHTQHLLKELYVNYFYYRQDDMWEKEAMQKLPELKRSTNMLVFGEDLGMVPHCVPDVMKQLGIFSLEIQRMPKELNISFSHPRNAPYLSVVTPSTHDMSTVREWWEEDAGKIQYFYNHLMGHYGKAPDFCTAEISKEIILQHLYSPAMWSIFQLQDILGMSETLRRKDAGEERINVPANPKHYWQYRMHISLEDLIKQESYNEELKGYIVASGR